MGAVELFFCNHSERGAACQPFFPHVSISLHTPLNMMVYCCFPPCCMCEADPVILPPEFLDPRAKGSPEIPKFVWYLTGTEY